MSDESGWPGQKDPSEFMQKQLRNNLVVHGRASKKNINCFLNYPLTSPDGKNRQTTLHCNTQLLGNSSRHSGTLPIY